MINVFGCLFSEKNIVGNVFYYLMFGVFFKFDVYNCSFWVYGNRIYDLCERRGYFDVGEFVEYFGDENVKRGFCLYKMGCKGFYIFNNCFKFCFNLYIFWFIGVGYGCIGCFEFNFWDMMSFFEEFLVNCFIKIVFDGLGVDKVVDKVGIILFSVIVIGIVVYVFFFKVIKNKE